jgi:hypothetical protein
VDGLNRRHLGLELLEQIVRFTESDPLRASARSFITAQASLARYLLCLGFGRRLVLSSH